MDKTIVFLDDIATNKDGSTTLFRRAAAIYHADGTTQLFVRLSLHSVGAEIAENSKFVHPAIPLCDAESMLGRMLDHCQTMLLAEYPQHEDVILSKKRKPL